MNTSKAFTAKDAKDAKETQVFLMFTGRKPNPLANISVLQPYVKVMCFLKKI